MGKCCGKLKQKPELPPEFFYIYCEDPMHTSAVVFDYSKPLQKYLESLDYKPHLYTILKGTVEISDCFDSLKALKIVPGDTVRLMPKVEEVAAEPSIIAYSLEEISEEQTNNRKNDSCTMNNNFQTASSLWRTAVRNDKILLRRNSHLRGLTPIESSVVSINTLDYSIKDKPVPPIRLTYQRQTIAVDSDESNLHEANNKLGNFDNARHPADYFKDIQGPFSIFRQF